MTLKTSGSKSLRSKGTQRATKKDRPGVRLTGRDLEMIKALYDYEGLSTPQVQALLFGDNIGQKTTCAVRLQKLFHNGYVWRGEIPGVWSGGRLPFFYRAEIKGLTALPTITEFDLATVDPAAIKRAIPGKIDHFLKVNDMRIIFTLAIKSQSIVTFNRWFSERQLRSTHAKDLVSVGQNKTEPAIVPDGYFDLWHKERRKSSHQFLEIDLASESAKSESELYKDWVTKIKGYLAYHHSGLYSQRYQAKHFRVLTITTGSRRAKNLKRKTEEAGGKNLFWFTTFDQLTSTTALLSPIWSVAGQDEPQALVW
jgi:hypothetical protein